MENSRFMLNERRLREIVRESIHNCLHETVSLNDAGRKAQNTINRQKNIIDKFNEELRQYVKTTGSNLVPDIDTTIIGSESKLYPLAIEDTDNGFTARGGCDNSDEINIYVYEDIGEYYIHGVEELKDYINYYKRQMKKGLKIWYSENPDTEIEKIDDEDNY